MNKTKPRSKVWRIPMKRLTLVFIICFLSSGWILQAQNLKSISGIVSDDQGPMGGVAVVVKGTSNGEITDSNGKFTVKANKGDVLVVSFLGYITQEVPVGNDNNLKITIQEDLKKLDEVVVVGYGTQKKGELTSSVAKVDSKNFVKGSVRDAAQLLQGKVAGLGIAVPSGDPTASTQITLRGVGSLKAGATPLIIIDGVPGDLNSVAPEDIASMDVLKDGSAAAIYGTRGSNGVIFITTKQAKGETPLTVDVQSYVAIQSIKRKLSMMNASEYIAAGGQDYGGNTNWLDEVTRTPVSSVTNASFKGGNAKSSYIANINYKNSNGIIKRTDNNILRTRLEVNHSMFDNKLKFNFNIAGTNQRYQALRNDGNFNTTIYQQALNNIPTQSTKNADGTWKELGLTNYYNAAALLNETEGEVKETQLRTSGSATFIPVESLFFKVLVSQNTNNKLVGYSETKQNYSSTVSPKLNGYASRSSEAVSDNLLELTSQYKRQFDKHQVTGLLGYSYQEHVYDYFFMQNADFPSDIYTYNNMGAGQATKTGSVNSSNPEDSWKESSKLIGFFGRVNYNYDGRFLASFSLRHEGSTKFGVNNKWGNFPAASVGWNISKESFMKNVSSISNLKLRLGYGVTGTVPTDPYMSINTLTAGSSVYVNGAWIPTIQPGSPHGQNYNANPNLKWETKEEWNFGVDYGFLDDRVTGSIDLYSRTTKDMLWDYAVPSPPNLHQITPANAGSIRNQGIEIGVFVSAIKKKDFSWNTSFNFSTNRNKLLSLSNNEFSVSSGYVDVGGLPEPVWDATTRLTVGGKVGDFRGYKAIDVDKNGQWIIQGADGKPKSIVDRQDEDKQIIGNGLPAYLCSWNNSLTYKNFDLNVSMRGAFGFDILNEAKMIYSSPQFISRGNLMTTAFDPVLNGKALSVKQDPAYVNYFVENGDYWKIDNVTLGYNYPLTNTKYIKRLRFYITGGNLITFTKYSGLDPEVNTQGLDPGCDPALRYPSTRTYTFGAMLTF